MKWIYPYTDIVTFVDVSQNYKVNTYSFYAIDPVDAIGCCRSITHFCGVYNSKRCGNCFGFAAMLSYADLSIGSLQERRYCFGNRIFSSFSRLLRSVCQSWHRDTCNMSCRGTSGRPSISWDGRKNGYTEIHHGEFCLSLIHISEPTRP